MTRMIRILCLALLTIGFVGPSPPARADDRDEKHEKCEKRIHQAEDKLHDAVNRHGEDSRQERKRREELEEAKKRCGDHHDMNRRHRQRRGRARTPGAPLRSRTRSISIATILRDPSQRAPPDHRACEKSSTANSCPPCSTTPTPVESMSRSRMFARCGGDFMNWVWMNIGDGPWVTFSESQVKCAPACLTRADRLSSPSNPCCADPCSAIASA